MTRKERKYINAIEQSIENFGAIQRDFVLDKRGIHALVRFIEDLEGHQPSFDLDDPVIQKAKTSVQKVIIGLKSEIKKLKKLEPSSQWKTFHDAFLTSLNEQLKGYTEMFKVFKDGKIRHIKKGQEIANRGVNLLVGGQKKSDERK
ncbi:MAG: hypothetical protein J7M18_07905 [Candidatus Eremiobacteraeota bacterium]|nr:hypothetical protein [Candidatus Eremiobacteraeota bacterium]